MPMFALNCMLQIEQVNSEGADFDNDPLVLALCFCAFVQPRRLSLQIT